MSDKIDFITHTYVFCTHCKNRNSPTMCVYNRKKHKLTRDSEGCGIDSKKYKIIKGVVYAR
jgi:hypothetical protein